MKRIALLLFLVVACDAPTVRTSTAQSVGPNGLARVLTSDAGICSGSGTVSNPITCALATDTTVTGTGSSGSPLVAVSDFDSAFFCDGSDGAVTFNGSSTVLGLVPSGNTYTMTRDICCASCTINAGVTIVGSWRFFDNGTLTLNGKIARNGGNGANGLAGTAAGGTATPAGWFEVGAVGGSASITTGSTGGGCTSVSPEFCTNTGGTAGAPPVAGGNCKGGGGGNGTQIGAAAGTMTLLGAGAYQGLATIIGGIDHRSAMAVAGAGACIASGGGGGGGSGSVSGGGGGAGGGWLFVAARQIIGSGSIEAKGGNGGNGSASGNTGGGGGGAGGQVFVLIGTGSFPTVTVTGGTGGTPGGTGAAGAAGGSGRTSLMRIGN